MTRTSRHRVRALVLTVVVVALLLPTTSSYARTVTTGPTAEAWYAFAATDQVTGPLCDEGVPAPGCSNEPLGIDEATRANPYPEDTLHVSIRAGTDDTITLLQLGTEPVELTGGLLVLPVAPPEDGTAAPALARFDACAVRGAVEDDVAAGRPVDAPEIDCEISSRAIYVAPAPEAVEDQGRFEVDLSPFTKHWATSDPAVALVPTDGARSEQDTWHVALHGSDRDVAEDRHIAAMLDLAESAQQPPPPPPPASPDPTPTPTATTEPPPPPTTTAPAPPPAAPPPPSFAASSPLVTASGPTAPVETPVAAPEASQPPPVAAPPAAATSGATASPPLTVVSLPVGLVHPAVYGVPLVALLLGVLVTTSLSTPLRLSSTDGQLIARPLADAQEERP